MEGSKKLRFFLLISFFAGSVVFMAAHELRAKTMRHGSGNPEEAHRLIQKLRGEFVVNHEAGYINPSEIPHRRPGDYLQENDRKALNSLLHRMLPSSSE